MRAYYNEIEPYCTAWLQNLMDAGEIAPGTIDDRSILDVAPKDLAGYDRCHFFAGIAGWDYALRLANFPEHLPVWTGSCPCQPFSSAGRGGRGADERHLWPAWFWLIQQCRPPIIFGEQVASKAGLAWLDVVFSDLEAAGYACGAADLCAASLGAPHIRQRLWFVAVMGNSKNQRCRWLDDEQNKKDSGKTRGYSLRPSPTGELADSTSPEEYQKQQRPTADERRWSPNSISGCGMVNPWATLHWLPCRDGKYRPTGVMADSLRNGTKHRPGESLETETTANGENRSLQGKRLRIGFEGSTGELADSEGVRSASTMHDQEFLFSTPGNGSTYNPWSNLHWLPCRDGKWRPTGVVADSDSNGRRTWTSRNLVNDPMQSTQCGLGERETTKRKDNPGCTGESRPTQSFIQPLAHGVPGILVYQCSLCRERKTINGCLNSGSTWQIPSTVFIRGSQMLGLWQAGEKTSPTSPKQRCYRQPTGEHKDSLCELSCQIPFEASHDFNLYGLRQDIYCQVEAQASENLFCEMCKRVGPHQCIKAMAQPRVGKLRAYGNAIVPQIAATFIQAVMTILADMTNPPPEEHK